MIPNSDQFKVSSLDAKRAEKQAAKSPYGPVQAGIVKMKPKESK